MNLLRQLIKESLLLEKRIAQLSANIKVTFSFDIDRSYHAYLRRTREGIENYDEREISNDEISYIIQLTRNEIAEKIILGEITEGEAFVIKSPEKAMAMSVVPKQEIGLYWKLHITTVFRESYENPFRVGRDQVVIWV
jgi:hypothetical protein